MLKKSCFLIILLFLSVNSAFADLKKELQQTIEHYLANKFLNATFRCEDGHGNQLAAGSYGVYDLNGKQLTAQQKMPIASGTKPMTAAAILKLQDKKLLNVNDFVYKHLKDDSKLWYGGKAPAWSKKVKIHHLLTHTSGLAEYFMGLKIDSTKPHAEINKDILNFAAIKPLEFEPGTTFKYTNTNFIILGLIIENISGTSLGHFFEDEFFRPLNMKNTHLATLEEALEMQKDAGNSNYPERFFLQPTETKPTFVPAKVDFLLLPFADGGVVSTTRDMITWYRALSQGKILSDKSFKLMIKKHQAIPDRFARKSYVGYGIFISELKGGKDLIYHGGSSVGIRSESGYIPGSNFYFSILSNVMLNMPVDKKQQIDLNKSNNQLDILYFRESILNVIEKTSPAI